MAPMQENSQTQTDARLPQLSARPDASLASHLAQLDVDVAMRHLDSSRAGLTQCEAQLRLKRFGHNVLPRPQLTPWALAMLGNFVHFFAIVLWMAAAIACYAGLSQLAWAIVIVIFVNGLFSYWQQYRAKQAVESLESLLPQQVTVRRNGTLQTIYATEIVRGDVILLASGDAIPADARLIHAEGTRVDISSLSGESRPVPRSVKSATAAHQLVSELPNIVLAGTTLAAGRAEAMVFATGKDTEFGRLAHLTHQQPEVVSTLQRELRHVTRLISMLAVAMGVVFFALGAGIAGLSYFDGFLFALGIIVANVPEGLLPTLSLTLAMGVRRMAARKAIVKRLERVETLGSVTVIVTDKTGTLTENQMTVREVWLPTGGFHVSDSGYAPVGTIGPEISSDNKSVPSSSDLERLLLNGALCCDAQLRMPTHGTPGLRTAGDPTEVAILMAAGKVGLNADRLGRFSRLAELPFDSVRKRMTTIETDGSAMFVCTKGAIEEVVPRCASIIHDGNETFLSASDHTAIDTAKTRLTSRGLRVLAVATRTVPRRTESANDYHPDEVEHALTFLGIIAMEDPPRPEVPAAVGACKEAGIRVVMATGDDGHTGAAIGREIGLCSASPQIVVGRDLDRLDQNQLVSLLADESVLFARVSPEHKLRIVEAFQTRGDVVAVTGDGVNDAPALKRADIGIAMGKRGTDVARQAADMILIDDNFATIIAAIEEGRAVHDNIRKFITYIFASNVPEIIPFIAFVLLKIPLPLTIMQILAVDLGTDLIPALALGAESAEPDVMLRPPRKRNRRLLDWSTLRRAYLWLGMIEGVLCIFGFLAAYWLTGWRPGMPLANSGTIYVVATTMSLAGIVSCQIGNGLACRSERKSVFQIGLLRNKFLLLGIALEVLLLLAFIYTPPLASVFHLAPLDSGHWLILATFGPLLVGCEEIRKFIVRRRTKEVVAHGCQAIES